MGKQITLSAISGIATVADFLEYQALVDWARTQAFWVCHEDEYAELYTDDDEQLLGYILSDLDVYGVDLQICEDARGVYIVEVYGSWSCPDHPMFQKLFRPEFVNMDGFDRGIEGDIGNRLFYFSVSHANALFAVLKALQVACTFIASFTVECEDWARDHWDELFARAKFSAVENDTSLLFLYWLLDLKSSKAA